MIPLLSQLFKISYLFVYIIQFIGEICYRFILFIFIYLFMNIKNMLKHFSFCFILLEDSRVFLYQLDKSIFSIFCSSLIIFCD